MSRLVILLLIGVLTLFSAPRAGMMHAAATPETSAHESSGHQMIGMVQDTLETAHSHDTCPDCLTKTLPADIPCPHGAICVLFTPSSGLEHRVSRTLQPVGFPAPSAKEVTTRAPALDLPPPRIGVTLA
ncbi:hypothetical protein [Celeribacter sp. PS-C1]|uniref:hypothetical protein n=1 Tax=Celeribacter sp. PS-C1 TaxID=2820813 RepID=UPI001CA54ECC|nr:hypothetical protein [Celeribacter sp. PS-C1]MBW6418803.1 hypothetical protein [Celeribacter sp. PS-C1]